MLLRRDRSRSEKHRCCIYLCLGYAANLILDMLAVTQSSSAPG